MERIGTIVDGEVTNITNFGAFIRLETGEEGLVHISEIANKYVNDINQFIKVADKVKVKILEVSADKKIKLSIKQAKEEPKKEGEKEDTLFLHKKSKNQQFEVRMLTFMKRSEEKLIDVRRNLKHKQGIIKRKKSRPK